MDIVDELREEANFAHKVTGCSIKRHTATRAANEIERLRSAVSDAVSAEREGWVRVRELASLCAEWHIGDGDECGEIARELYDLLMPNV